MRRKEVLHFWTVTLEAICFFAATEVCLSNTEDNTFEKQPVAISEIDTLIIELGHIEAASEVAVRVRQLLKKDGREAVQAYVPALIRRVDKLHKAHIEHLRSGTPYLEKEGEVELQILELLNQIGDVRAKEVLLQAMGSGVVGLPQWDGFVAMGKVVLPDLVDSLKSISSLTKVNATRTLVLMAKQNPSLFTPQSMDTIRTRLIRNLEERTGWVRRRTIEALGDFGNASTIPILEEAARDDMYMEAGNYINRLAANDSIEKLKAHLQRRNPQ